MYKYKVLIVRLLLILLSAACNEKRFEAISQTLDNSRTQITSYVGEQLYSSISHWMVRIGWQASQRACVSVLVGVSEMFLRYTWNAEDESIVAPDLLETLDHILSDITTYYCLHGCRGGHQEGRSNERHDRSLPSWHERSLCGAVTRRSLQRPLPTSPRCSGVAS